MTSPRRTAARAGPARPLATELVEQTALGEVYVDTLMRRQLRAAAFALAMVATGLGGIAAVFALVPATQTVTVGGLPLSWIALGALSYPALLLVGIGYLRTSERAEREFTGWRRRG